MKKILSFVLIVIMVLSPSVISYAEGDSLFLPGEKRTDISLNIPVKSLEKGDDVYLEVLAKDITNLYAFSAEFTYDEEAFDFSEVKTVFDTKKGEEIIRTDDGRVSFAFTNVGDSDEVDKKLIRLTLTAKKLGTFKINLNQLMLVYNDMSYVEYPAKNATVKITKKEEKDNNGGGTTGGFSAGGGYTATAVPTPMVTPMPASTPAPMPEFDDLGTAEWAKEAIGILRDKGIVNGYEDNKFMPENKVTRAEFAKMISIAFSFTKGETEKSFTDVSENDWFFDSVILCSSNNIILGDESGFRPNDNISREEMAVIILRSMLQRDTKLDIKREYVKFTDETDIENFAMDAVQSLYRASVLNGDADGCFRPKDSLSRAEAAKVIYEVIK